MTDDLKSPAEPELRVAVFVSGRGSNLRALLDAKASGRLARVQFRAVFSDRPAPPALKHARRDGVPTFHLAPDAFPSKADFETAILDRLQQLDINFIVLAGYMQIVGPTLLAAFEGRIINIHPSLLPAFPGLHAQRQALIASADGVTESGCTVHFVDAGVDTGPIILQRRVAIEPEDTEETLAARILAEEHLALTEALGLIRDSYLVSVQFQTSRIDRSKIGNCP